MPVAGKVNETLSKQMSYKGPDGLTDIERRAYEVCKPLSCKHEQCYKRFMYSSPQKQKEQCDPRQCRRITKKGDHFCPIRI